MGLGRLPGGGGTSWISKVAWEPGGPEVGTVFLSEETTLPSALGRGRSWLECPFLPLAAQRCWKHRWVEILSPLPTRSSVRADAAHYSDCRWRRWRWPRARLRITQGPGKAGGPGRGSAPHPRNPRGRCSESFPHRPAKIVLPLCSTHARRRAISSPRPLSLWEQLAGPPGHLRVAHGTESGGLGWPATLGPGAPPAADVPGRRFSGHLLGGGQAGSGFTAHLEGQIHAVLCWMPGPVKSRWLTCYLWCPPDSGLILSFWVGHDASASQSTNRPEELINQSQPASFTQGSCILLEASGNGLFCIFLGSLSVCCFTGGTFHGVCYGIFT